MVKNEEAGAIRFVCLAPLQSSKEVRESRLHGSGYGWCERVRRPIGNQTNEYAARCHKQLLIVLYVSGTGMILIRH